MPHSQEYLALERAAYALVDQFLAELDACTTVEARRNKTMELIFGITKAARQGEAHDHDTGSRPPAAGLPNHSN